MTFQAEVLSDLGNLPVAMSNLVSAWDGTSTNTTLTDITGNGNIGLLTGGAAIAQCTWFSLQHIFNTY